jgi:hypothetical protein
MSEHFRTIDMSGFVLPGEVESRFSYADVPAVSGMPFVIVHLKDEHTSTESLRMDLDKRVFLGDVSDEKLRAAAPVVAQHISGVAFPASQMAGSGRW